MDATINVDGVGGQVELREGVLEAGGELREGVPVGLGDAIPQFPTIYGCEFEGAVEQDIAVEQVYPTVKGHKAMACGMGFGCIRWTN